MSTFAVAAFHEPSLPAGARTVEAVVWIRAAGLGTAGSDVALVLWTPAHAAVVALREVAPDSADRLAGAVRVDERTVRVDAGRWLDGVHEFELAVELPAREPGEAMLAARVGVLAGGEPEAGALVTVRWTEAAREDDLGPAPAGPAPSGAEAGSASERTAAVSSADLPTGAESARTAAVGSGDLPTGASARPRHTSGAEAGPGSPCAGCGERPDDGDRFCEACGRELAAG